MEHLNEQDLLDYVGGHLSSQQTQKIQDHLVGCQACRQQIAPLQQAWDALGAWEAMPASGLDLTDRILAHLPAPVSLWQIQRSELLRIAASVLIAIGVGHLTARALRRPQNPALDETTQTEILEILGRPSATGLLDPLLIEASPTGGTEE